MSTALVLSGGGAKGAFGAGVAAALADEGIDPDILAGTSAGALNAAAVACGLTDELIDLWCGVESGDVFRPRFDVHTLLRPLHLLSHPDRLLGLGSHSTSEHLLDSIGWTWLFHLGPLRARLVDLLGGETLPIRDGVTLTVTCVQVGTGELVRFTNRPLPDHRVDPSYRVTTMTVDHLLASASIPGVFAPVEVDGGSYWDGGLGANTPLTAAMAHEPDTAFVVASGAIDREGQVPRSLGEAVSLMVDHLLRFGMLKDLDHAATVNELVRANPTATRHREVELVPIVPDSPRAGLGELLDFDPAVAGILVEEGRREGHEALASWRSGELPDLGDL